MFKHNSINNEYVAWKALEIPENDDRVSGVVAIGTYMVAGECEEKTTNIYLRHVAADVCGQILYELRLWLIAYSNILLNTLPQIRRSMYWYNYRLPIGTAKNSYQIPLLNEDLEQLMLAYPGVLAKDIFLRIQADITYYERLMQILTDKKS